jgi:glycine oxidase
MVADVTVVGYGLVALASTLALADRGLSVRIVGTKHRGEASSAAGGILAPSISPPEDALASAFMRSARDFYPGYVAALVERTGIAVPLNRLGILQLALDEAQADALRASIPEGSRWLDSAALAREEPAVAHAVGAVWHPDDGAVEPLALMDALSAAVARHEGVAVAREDVCSIDVTELGCNVLTDRESRFASDHLVLAAGAWTPLIVGAGAEAIEPVRGQMVAFDAAPVRQVVYGASGYLIPRHDGHTVAGSTSEHVGFDADVTDQGVATISAEATRTCPALASSAISSTWAGLRPMTPDALPIIGPDPERPRLSYACGHSRNGILLAPITAEVVADLVTGSAPRHDLSRFRPGRFSR